MASQTELKKRLKVLMNKPENQVCSDCPERQPRWASLIVPPPGSPPGTLPIGAFCCLECSGSHRRLGVHISFVRSVNLDSWKEKEVLSMERGGNKKVNAIFEARLGTSGSRKPTTHADGQTRERFIRDKYERRKFYDPSAMQNLEESSEESSEEEVPARSARRSARAPPSEVARRRVESRQARMASSSKSSGTVAAIPAKPKVKQPKAPVRAAPAPAPAAQVDLLDFSADFSKAPEAPSPQPSPTEAAAAAAPSLDLFGNMTISGFGAENNNPNTAPESSPAKKQEPARASNDQILAMFNSPVQQQTGFGSGMNGMMMGGGMMPQQQGMNPAMMQQQQHPNMMMMQNNGMMVGGKGMMPQQTGMNPAIMQQQQQNMMMMQANGYGNPNMMLQNNMTMQHQVKPMVQPNGNMMNQEGFGFPQMPMVSGPPIGTTPQGMPMQKNQMKVAQGGGAPAQTVNDPFAEFSTNGFRS